MNAKIIVIDAHPVYVNKTVDVLRILKFKHVIVVDRGAEAMRAVIKHKPEVIVMSASLPDADSVELCRQIHSEYPAVAIIVQTGLLTERQTIDALRVAGASHIIPRREKDWAVFEQSIFDVLSVTPQRHYFSG